MMDPVAFMMLVASVQQSGASFSNRILEWANISEPWEIGLIAFGLGAQILFFCRWIVQWYVSEKRGESHIPDLFWWLSLAGASLLLVYFILRGEPVGVLGQSVGWIVYFRNLHLIRRKKRISEAD